ncbi:MAG TPA: hypothetical protein VN540_07045 [Clostridia bacterium]|nr:hypothetical protein [Clostridia bacterium]
MPIPDYLTRHYITGEDPFLSLNDLPPEEANRIRKDVNQKYGWGGFYGQDDYLLHRSEIENWIHAAFIKKGGKPQDLIPVYFFLGDVVGAYKKFAGDTSILKVPLSSIDHLSISFVWPDSMYVAERGPSGFTGACQRTNTPQVFTYDELEGIVMDVRAYNDLPCRTAPPACVEAQVWNRCALRAWFASCHTCPSI